MSAEDQEVANTLNDLYLKYVNRVGKTLENDRYFQYLFEMVQAGNNVIQQKHQVLKKVVDERWLSVIEESLDAINTIIEKPRRFVTTTEEVVPVALAKKITADSVRHLSMNTQFIASDEDGEIQPTRILNVTTEETFDLYENRFIYHLIQRLVAFVDKRTDVIFWSTGNETRNTLNFQSKVDDAYEEIEYKIEMNIKNRQSFAENDSDNMQVFMRIDRVRRMVMALKNSSFCSLMAGCAKVRSPIQRTNLMMKDPYYRTCYKLWQFLESYDEVGYTIEVEDSALEFDEEYLLQLYTNLITNYTVFKSILDGENRDIEEAAKKRRKVLKPKFVKQIKEEFVENYDIPDVEIRKVLVEEVTQAQLDAEAKLEEEKKLREEAEEAQMDAERSLQETYQQMNSMMQQQMALEDELEALKKETAAQAEAAKLEADAQIKAARQEADAQIEAAKQEAQTQIEATKQEADARIEAAKQESDAQIEAIKQDAKAQLEKKIQRVEEQARLEAESQINKVRREADSEISRVRSEAEEKISQMRLETDNEISTVRQEEEAKTQEQISKAHEEAQYAIESARSEAQSEIENARSEAQDEIRKTRLEALSEISKVRKETEDKISRTQKEAQSEIDQIRQEAMEQVQKAEKAKKRAEEKAQGTRLSRYIIAALSKNSQQDEREEQDESKP